MPRIQPLEKESDPADSRPLMEAGENYLNEVIGTEVDLPLVEPVEE